MTATATELDTTKCADAGEHSATQRHARTECPTTEAPELVLWVNRSGGWDWTRTKGHANRVTFTGPDADAIAADYLTRRTSLRDAETGELRLEGGLVVEPDEHTEWDSFPKVLAKLHPTCEHGMSADLCMGPEHFPSAEQERQLWG